MDKIISCIELNDKINSLQFQKSVMSYATNSVYINLYDGEEEIGYFMINPLWRIVNKNKIIQSSDVYPFHSRFNENEEDKESQEFYKWCSKTDDFRNTKIKKITIIENGDIEFEWENGIKLQHYIFDYEDYSYYFYNIKEKMMYEVWFGRCIIDYYERKRRNLTPAST